MFESNGIVLKKLEFEDIGRLVSLKNESWFATHQNTFLNKSDQETWFKSFNSNPNNPKNLILMAFNGNQEISERIGIYKILNIDWISRKADVGWDVFKIYRNKGYGKKIVKAGSLFCFELFNLHRLDAEILENNTPSIKCAEDAGFVLEGTKRSCIFKKDKYLNSLIYGLLRD